MRGTINRTGTPETPDAEAQRIRNGVKTERDTQPVQIRMLKAQVKVLKQIAEQEDRSSSDVIRDLVDAYIAHALTKWPKGHKLDILRSTVQANGYVAENHPSAERTLAWLRGEKYVPPTGLEKRPSWMSAEEWAKEQQESNGPKDTKTRQST
ncbi:putative uncharacterized protein [Caballeronia cordobensis]|nr:putative uncharacterized protein [Burkholderia sp. RPE67]